MSACLLAISIAERRWEAARPAIVRAVPAEELGPDNAVWGRDFPREYESYRNTEITETRTLYGGAVPRDYLDEFPDLAGWYGVDAVPNVVFVDREGYIVDRVQNFEPADAFLSRLQKLLAP